MDKITKCCVVDGCMKKIYGAGYCSMHYKQIRRHGRLTPEREQRTNCSIEGCENRHLAKGLCKKHYYKKMRDDKRDENSKERIKNRLCSVEGCDNKHTALSYCQKHYKQFKKYGRVVK